MLSYSTYGELELSNLLKSGDEIAFAEIYERYWETLFGMAYNRLKEIPAAEDAVHDVFASLWKNREQSEIKSLQKYLAVALKYVTLRAIYRKQLNTEFLKAQDASKYAEMKTEEMDFISVLNKELDELPPKCRVIFELSRMDGMTNSEIADKLDISVKTVENQINKAQRHLRIAFKNSYLLALFFIR